MGTIEKLHFLAANALKLMAAGEGNTFVLNCLRFCWVLTLSACGAPEGSVQHNVDRNIALSACQSMSVF
jgi:hypothetical protein